MGMGSMTGRGMGYCSGATPSGMPARAYGYGFGRGCRRSARMGYGRGFGFANANADTSADVPATDRKTLLEDQAAFLKERLNAVESQLSKLDGDA